MSLFSKLKQSKVAQVIAATFALAVTSVQPALAAVPAGVTTALADANTDVVTIGGTVLVIIVAIATFKYLRRGL